MGNRQVQHESDNGTVEYDRRGRMHMREELHEVALEHSRSLVFVRNKKPAHDLGNSNNFRLAIKCRLGPTFRQGLRAGLGALNPRKQGVAFLENKLEEKPSPR